MEEEINKKVVTPKEFVLDAIKNKNKATIVNALKHYYKLVNYYKKDRRQYRAQVSQDNKPATMEGAKEIFLK